MSTRAQLELNSLRARARQFVMEGLFWSDTPVLKTISTHEGETPELRATGLTMCTRRYACTSRVIGAASKWA